MKRNLLVMLLSLAMVLTMAAGCSPSVTEPTGDDTAAVKTGLAVISSIAKSADAGEENGTAQVDSVVVAVTVDMDGKIVSCKIDTAQTRIAISNEGKVATPLDTVYQSKQELGEAYGMARVSSIAKEWNEQADALAAYVQGKTVEEVKGIAVNEEGAPTAADLATSVTMHVTDYIAAIEKAVGNAQDLGAKAGDKLGLGVRTTIDKSKDAGDEDGVAQAYSNYAAVTFGEGNVITSCVIESSQTNVSFDAQGVITADKAMVPQTKNELGAAYGMARVSSIGKEWNEQAAALSQYVVGKTVDEVKGIAVNAEGVPTGADLVSSVTMHIGDYITVIEKAGANASK